MSFRRIARAFRRHAFASSPAIRWGAQGKFSALVNPLKGARLLTSGEDNPQVRSVERGEAPIIIGALVAGAAATGALGGGALWGGASPGTLFAPKVAAEAGTYGIYEGTTMSAFSVSDILSTAQQGLSLYQQARGGSRPPVMQAAMGPAAGAALGLGGLALSALPMIGGAVVRGGAAIARSALTYCRRNPAWCASIGGTAAIAGLIESGQLPTVRRRRGRGITPRDLRSFRRVAGIIKDYCPTVRRLPSRAVHVRRTGISHAR